MAWPHTFATLQSPVAMADLDDNFNAAAQLDSPPLIGVPTAPTAAPGTSTTQLATTAFVQQSGLIPRNYISGLTLSNDGSTPNTVLDIAAGQATNTAENLSMTIGAFTKTTGGSWVAGSGNAGMGVGLTIANSTWYHVFLIVNSGTSDIYFDTSVSAANRPVGTTSFRRIGSFLTDSSAHIIPFSQNGNEFLWVTPPTVLNDSAAFPTVATSLTMVVPTGVIVNAIFGGIFGSTTILQISFGAVLQTLSPTTSPNSTASSAGGSIYASIRTDTAGHVRWIATGAGSGQTRIISTLGWIDTRGAG